MINSESVPNLPNKVAIRRIRNGLLWSSGISLFILYYRALSYTTSSFSLVLGYMWTVLCNHPFFFLVLFVTIFLSAFFISQHAPLASNFLYRFRWPLAGIVLVGAVALKISGSSIGMWVNYLPGSSNDGLLLGSARAIRSDEWAVFTPLALSQLANPDSYLEYFSTVVRATATDMNIYYPSPILDFVIVFRPFEWGYLLLGAERGLSFWWCSKLILLFMLSFESAYILTRKNRGLSLAFACLVAFSPAIQWWFSSQITDQIVYAEAVLVLFWYYFKTENYKARIAMMPLVVVAAGAFIFTLYVPWLVCISYLLIALLIPIIVHWARQGHFNLRKDGPIIGCGLLLLGACVVYVLTKSSEAIVGILNTAQGSRTTGGGTFSNLTNFCFYVMSIFFPIGSPTEGLSTNVCEVSTFYDFFPLGIILSALMLCKQIKRKEKIDVTLIVLLLVTMLLGLYITVEFPSWLRTVTLLSFVTVSRVIPIFSLANLLLLFRSVALLAEKPHCPQTLGNSERNGAGRFATSRLSEIQIALIELGFSGLLAFMVVVGAYVSQPDYVTLTRGFIAAVLLTLAFFLLVSNHLRQFIYLAIVLAIICGVVVNPVQIGIPAIYDNDLSDEITELVQEDTQAVWLVETDNTVMTNYTIMLGAPTVNSVNKTPNRTLYETLDSEGEYEDVWNRYAYVTLELIEGKSYFEYVAGDVFKLYLSVSDLATTKATYILSQNDLTRFNNEDLSFTVVYSTDSWSIFEIEYS